MKCLTETAPLEVCSNVSCLSSRYTETVVCDTSVFLKVSAYCYRYVVAQLLVPGSCAAASLRISREYICQQWHTSVCMILSYIYSTTPQS
jgi:hypothetical protein